MFGWGSFLRIGVACAVFDDDGRVLLSHRGDIDVWNLPTGRLDAHEPITEAVAREVLEETGVIAGLEQPVGLYFLQATGRLNILFNGYPVGGEVQSQTDESRNNQYFWLTSMPENTFGTEMAHAALEPEHPTLYVIHTPAAEIREIRRKLAWRWVKNLLRGRPEPRHVRFDMNAVGVIWDETGKRILTVHSPHGAALPRSRCKGNAAPWDSLTDRLRQLTNQEVSLSWIGLWQQPFHNQIEFVFEATVAEIDIHAKYLDWMIPQNAALIGRDADFVAQATQKSKLIWVMLGEYVQPDVIES